MEQASALSRSRLISIDAVRGVAILLMLVDHMRETIYLHKQVSDPMDVSTTEPGLFFTRLSAHICAPIFVFLTGLSASLYAHSQTGQKRSPRRFLLTRGLFLIALELVVINFAWTGAFPPEVVYLQVIWAIGLSMVALSLAINIPYAWLLTLGLTIVFGHNLLTPISFQAGEWGYTLWTILHDRNYLETGEIVRVRVSYPLLPWIGVIILGYCAGRLFQRPFSQVWQCKALLSLGCACLLLLLLLRGFNLYGETLPWVAGRDLVTTLMSFLNYTKYPPSLAFLLFSLGIGSLLFACVHSSLRESLCLRKPIAALAVFGSAPMFIYVLHLYVLLFGYRILLLLFGPNQGERFGVDSIFWVWIFASLLVFVLYFPTRFFANYKRHNKVAHPWLSYF